jgi:D-alanyl-lipoteichoic acid acyltransferase DltB (MBOAT superfamily)
MKNEKNESITLSCPIMKANNEKNDKKSRKENYLDLSEYNVVNFTIYILYAPLYIAGPIITFNDFIIRYECFGYLLLGCSVISIFLSFAC